jgi:hypothetical protein
VALDGERGVIHPEPVMSTMTLPQLLEVGPRGSLLRADAPRRERVRRVRAALVSAVAVHCEVCAESIAERIVRELEGK